MSHTSLSGLKLDSYQIHELVGSGAFGNVYRASDKDGKNYAIKVANEAVAATGAFDDGIFSKALALYSGGFGNITPVPSELLQIQCDKSQDGGEIFPATAGPFRVGSCDYLVMEYLEGITLRKILIHQLRLHEDRKSVNDLNLAIALYQALITLQKTGLGCHGDLKPENIMFCGEIVKILDPGYYGALACREGMIPRAVVSTSQYYPCLEPDDGFACGAILWEICLGTQLLSVSTATIPIAHRRVRAFGKEFKQMLAYQEMMGRYFLSPLRNFVLPSEIQPQISEQVDALILQSLGLELSNGGALERLPVFPSAEDILVQLQALKQAGTTMLNPSRF